MDTGSRENAGEGLKVLSRDAIKYIAMFTMFLNHMAHVLLTRGTILYEVFEDIGIFTAPVMCFFLVEGYEYTTSKVKYGRRILIFAFLSQIPYQLALQDESLNMIYTLFCCFLILVTMEWEFSPVYKVAVCTLLTIATAVGDWALVAPVSTILLYLSRNSRIKTAYAFGAAYAVFVPFQIQKYMYGVPGDWTLYAVWHGLLSGVGILAAGVAVLVFYNGKRAKRGQNFSKWFFYIFYPVHLMALYLIKVYITRIGVIR